MNDERYSLQELSDAAGVSPRTVRYYIAEGLLPPPEPAGHKTSYSGDHLNRLRLIGLLKEAYLPLKEIRTRLAGIGNEDLASALAEAERARVPGDDEMETSADRPAANVYRTRVPASSPAPYEPVRLREDALAYIDRVLDKQRPVRSIPRPPVHAPRQDAVWRRLPIGAGGEAELVIAESLYQRRRDRIDALLVWAEKMLEQD
ncbi:MAG: MerR family transcriptional regulator [Thermomicrobiales bacterium]|nr:MerR family transcriptional regulator [Thermomicrobiales bacterium]